MADTVVMADTVDMAVTTATLATMAAAGAGRAMEDTAATVTAGRTVVTVAISVANTDIGGRLRL